MPKAARLKRWQSNKKFLQTTLPFYARTFRSSLYHPYSSATLAFDRQINSANGAFGRHDRHDSAVAAFSRRARPWNAHEIREQTGTKGENRDGKTWILLDFLGTHLLDMEGVAGSIPAPPTRQINYLVEVPGQAPFAGVA
jgi:hypothetical protein